MILYILTNIVTWAKISPIPFMHELCPNLHQVIKFWVWLDLILSIDPNKDGHGTVLARTGPNQLCVCVVLFFSRMSLECELNYACVAASVVSIYVNFCTFIYIAIKGEIHKKVNYLSKKKKKSESLVQTQPASSSFTKSRIYFL